MIQLGLQVGIKLVNNGRAHRKYEGADAETGQHSGSQSPDDLVHGAASSRSALIHPVRCSLSR